MQDVQQPMDNGSEKNGRCTQERQPTVKRIERRKQFCNVASHFCHWTHTREYHAGHMKAVNPTQSCYIIVPCRPDAEGNKNQEGGKCTIPCQSY